MVAMRAFNSAHSASGPSTAQHVLEAISGLRGLRHRALLALLGIVMGSACIISLINIGRNAAQEMARIFQSMGTDKLVVQFPYSPQTKARLPGSLDVAQVLRSVPSVTAAAPIAVKSAKVFRGGRSVDVSIVGATASFARIIGLSVQRGRFISPFDDVETFAVVGPSVARALSSGGSTLQTGMTLRIGGYFFTVIGMTDTLPANPMLPNGLDDSVFIPLNSMRRVQPGYELSSVIAQAAPEMDPGDAAKDLKQYLSALLPGRAVEIQAAQQLLDGLRRQSRVLSYLLGALGAISLLLGGVGVMNVMLMSVTERRKEIGVRMALGARPRDIRTLFLLEAICLSACGSALGAVLGIAFAYLFARFCDWQFFLALDALAIGIGSAASIGVFFGLYPAIAASRLEPVTQFRDF